MNIYDIVTAKIIEKLNEGTIPWQKGWLSDIPQNYVTKQPYRGINKLLTSISPYKYNNWITFIQAKQLGLKIKKGEKGTSIIYYRSKQPFSEKLKKDSDEQSVTGIINRPFYTINHIFNLEQTDYVEPPDRKQEKNPPVINRCKEIIQKWKDKPEIRNLGNKAFYSFTGDYIQLPKKNTFYSIEEYYSTLFHEAIHSTGHHSRLNRKITGVSKQRIDENYSQEELIAEIGASFLCDHAGIINSVIDNQAAYIYNWLKALTNDKMLIMKASSLAQQAADYILSEDNNG
ncbi:MAG TPA: hypothetical protein DC057_14500 [Spirochaetia bacterium]|nr:hypothetical protein [Spirochaetia bacterium]